HRRPRLQRLHVHRPRRRLDRRRPGRRRGRRARRVLRPPARRRPRPRARRARRDRHSGPDRRLGTRQARGGRADHGLRPRRLHNGGPAVAPAPRHRPRARRRAGRVRLRGRGAGGGAARRGQARPDALRQRRVLRGGGDGDLWHPARHVHPDVRGQPGGGLGRQRAGTDHRAPDHPTCRPLRRTARPAAGAGLTKACGTSITRVTFPAAGVFPPTVGGRGMAVGETVSTNVDTVEIHERKPLMSGGNILLMNLGFFGVQFSFGLTQSAVNPLFTLIGADPEQLPILNIAGPITGLIIQPLIGAISDKTWSDRWGRRKPFILAGAFLCAVVLFLFPFVGVLWLGVLCLWLLDIGNNTSMEPYRALLSERLPDSQVARGFLTQSMFTGAGAVLANLSLFILQKVIVGNAANGVPYWMYAFFMIGTVVILVTMLVAMIRTKELKPSPEVMAEIEAAPKGLGSAVKDIAEAVKDMPVAMHKIGVAFLFQWYAMFIYWQFVAVSLGESIFGADPETGGEAWDQAISWSGLENATYNLFTMIFALFLVGWCQKIGAKRVHALCLGFAAVSLVWLANISNQYVALLPMIGMGIAWASMTGVPSLMVVTMVPSRRIGVYLGILNMMVVVPMLIQTLTFGWIYEHLLGGKGTNAIMLAGVLLGCGAISMLWVNSPRPDEESPIVPLGAPRHFHTVYDEVIVGSDGTP